MVIGAPYPLTDEVLDHFNISVVVRGKIHEGHHDVDPFQAAVNRGIFKVQSNNLN